MNTASQNLPHHLGELRQRMVHPTDYELAVNYFLEEFAGDVKFMNASEPDQQLHLLAVLARWPPLRWESRRSLMIQKFSNCGSIAFIMGMPSYPGAWCCSSIFKTPIPESRRSYRASAVPWKWRASGWARA